MQEYAESFYKSQAWQECRDSYIKSVGMICERCSKKGLMTPAEIVHHKKPITLRNIDNPDITLNFDNLMAVCRQCHAELHKKVFHRYTVTIDGKVIGIKDN